MEYHLDRKLVLSDSSEHKSLYSWSLQELDDSGNKLGRDLIPWGWDLSFYAEELMLRSQLTIERDYGAETGKSPQEVTRSRSIVGKLRPLRSGGERWTSYSMFGTDRRISDFTLFIKALAEGETLARCSAWGGVSFAMEHDFRHETVEDGVTLTLEVTPEDFERYAEAISSGAVDLAILRVGGVAGFYSDWSPSISTSSIKVLTAGKEHKVDIPEGCGIEPPRLGRVSSADFTLRVARAMDLRLLEEDAEVEPAVADAPMVLDRSRANLPAPADPRMATLVSSIRFAAWVIAGLLLLNLFR